MLNVVVDLVQQMSQTNRKIIHVDMDYFYAQVEIRDNPILKDKYVVVAHDSERSVISTCSYNARALGIKSGMSVSEAKKISDQLFFVEPHMDKYKKVHKQIMEILYRYSDIVEPMSLDEAYLDVTYNKLGIRSATRVAKEIQFYIYKELQLTCSIGVSYNKFLAKIGSDLNKPHGISVIKPLDSLKLVKNLPIEKFMGVGRKNKTLCYQHGIYKGKDLLNFSLAQLQLIFGQKFGEKLYYYARGIDESRVISHREMQSVSCEHTLETDLRALTDIEQRLYQLSEEVAARLVNKQVCGKTITLKLKLNNFDTITKSHTLKYYIVNANDIYPIVIKLLKKVNLLNYYVRLIGISISNLEPIKRLETQIKYRQIYLPILGVDDEEF